jgi:hemerythrin-like domain-containing protein
MIKKNKKASRNENLTVLSHEHHHGLIFCNRLTKTSKTDNETVKRYILDFWNNYLVDHFDNEERAFLPFLKNEELTVQFLEEHKTIKKLIAVIEKAEDNLQELALAFSKMINAHIRFEERVFFPWLEKELSADALIKVGKIFENMEITAHEFSPKFWEN